MKRLSRLAILLPMAITPARAETWDYSFDTWISGLYSVAGTGQIISAARASGVPVFVVAQFSTRLTAWVSLDGSVDPFCNNHPDRCREAVGLEGVSMWQGPSRNLTITSARWWSSYDNGPGLLFGTTDSYASNVSSHGDLILSLAAPGPLAGTSLPAVAGLLFVWGLILRRQRQTSPA